MKICLARKALSAKIVQINSDTKPCSNTYLIVSSHILFASWGAGTRNWWRCKIWNFTCCADVQRSK